MSGSVGLFLIAHAEVTGISRPKETLLESMRFLQLATGKEGDMTRLLAIAATVLALGLAPAMATENSSQPTKPPTANTISPEASKSATMPSSGSADTSGGATEQSSSPPSAGSTMGKTSQQSSSPSGQTTPNPTAPSSND
jgi:hypothetical protein